MCNRSVRHGRFRRGLLLLLVACGLHYRAQSQVSPEQQPKFEVASVRLSSPSGWGTSYSAPDAGMFRITNGRLAGLIMKAFAVQENQIAGLPKWADNVQYDIMAKPPEGVHFTELQNQQALQRLLQDRLHLVVHRETRQVQGYKLVSTRDKRPGLTPPQKGWRFVIWVDRDGLEVPNTTLHTFAPWLHTWLGDAPVVDASGIEVNFDIKLRFATEGNEDSGLPSIFTAVQEQLGLKLVPAKVPVDTIVVDHVEQVPTEN